MQAFQRLLISTNFNPVHVRIGSHSLLFSLSDRFVQVLNTIRQHPELYQPPSNLKRIANTLALMIERSLDPFHTKEPNDILAIKVHYLKTFVDHLVEKNADDAEKSCTDWCKKCATLTSAPLDFAEPSHC